MEKYSTISTFLIFLWISSAGISAQSLSEAVEESYTDLHFHFGFPFQEIVYDHFHDYLWAQSQDPSSFRIVIPEYITGDLVLIDSIRIKYNDSENLTLRERFKYNNGVWINYMRTEFKYDTQSNLLMETAEEFEDGNWVYTSRWLYEYDHNNNLLTEIYQLFEIDTDQFEDRTIHTYEYDDNNNLIKYIRQWVDSNGNIVNSKQQVSTFDSLKNIEEAIEMNWRDDEWQNTLRQTFEYNGDNQLICSSLEIKINQNWRMNKVDSIVYENQWNEPSEIRSYWFDDQSEMHPRRFFGMTYDQDGILDTAYDGTWREDAKDFRISRKIFLALDEGNNKATIKIKDNFPPSDEFFLIDNLHEFDILNDGNIKSYSFSRPLLGGLKYRVEYFYDSGEELTNLREIEAESLSVFPNPATDYINLRIGEVNGPHKVYLTNTVGQKQLIAEIPNGAEEVHIDLRDVSAGFYQLHLQTQNQGSFSTQLIIQK